MSEPSTAPALQRIDLHTHSNASDGLYAPAELVRRAREAGLDLIALVDHDTTAGLDEAQAAGAQLGLAVMPGVEINTDIVGGGEAHLLGYEITPDDASLAHNLAILRDARERRGERMVEKLRDAGFDISWEQVRQIAKGAVGRPHVARALINAGYAKDVPDAFERYLSRGRIGYAPRYKLSPEDAIRVVRSARGVPSLAHPAEISELETFLLPRLVAVGLQGLECYYGPYDEATVERLLALAQRFGLIATGGSDYHGPNMHPTPLGGRFVPPEVVARLHAARQEALARADEPFTLTPPNL